MYEVTPAQISAKAQQMVEMVKASQVFLFSFYAHKFTFKTISSYLSSNPSGSLRGEETGRQPSCIWWAAEQRGLWQGGCQEEGQEDEEDDQNGWGTGGVAAALMYWL